LFAAAGIPFIVDILFASKPVDTSYLYMGILFGIVMIGLLISTGVVSKERVEGERSQYHRFIETIVYFLKLKEFQQVNGMYLFNSIYFMFFQVCRYKLFIYGYIVRNCYDWFINFNRRCF